MLLEFLQAARAHGEVAQAQRSAFRALRHLGAAGLFFLAILDSSPLPTFGGPDILTAILAASHRSPWYVYAAVATAGSVIGACITFRLARKAGIAYLDSKFGHRRVVKLLKFFQRWGTGALVASSAIPFPFPTSALFAAAGASDYDIRKYVIVVALARGVRYSAVAIIAAHYGRHFIRVLRHPVQYWGWLLVFIAIIVAVIATGVLINKRMEQAAATRAA